MQTFFYRAILCDFNILFVVKINISFSEFQKNNINIYNDTILSYKNKIFNESEKKNIEKNKANLYLKSCIVFVYEQNNSFLNELEKFNIQEIPKIKRKTKNAKNLNKKVLLKNGFLNKKDNLKINNSNKIVIEFVCIKIITSDICGL
jgi:hypothetical protein